MVGVINDRARQALAERGEMGQGLTLMKLVVVVVVRCSSQYSGGDSDGSRSGQLKMTERLRVQPPVR